MDRRSVSIFADQSATPPINYQFTSSLEGSPATWVAGTDIRPSGLQRPRKAVSTDVNYKIENTAATGDSADARRVHRRDGAEAKADGTVDTSRSCASKFGTRVSTGH